MKKASAGKEKKETHIDECLKKLNTNFYDVRSDPNFLVHAGGVVVGILVLIVYACQLGEMITANRINREGLQSVQKQFAVSHRPWTTVSIHTSAPLVFQDGQGKLSVEFTIRNGGSAVSVGTSLFEKGLKIIPDETPIDKEDFRSWTACDQTSSVTETQITDVSGFLILPGDSTAPAPKDLVGPMPLNKPTLVSVWVPFCLRYKDDLGGYHGAGLLWEFVADNGTTGGTPKIAANGSTKGRLIPVPFGNTY